MLVLFTCQPTKASHHWLSRTPAKVSNRAESYGRTRVRKRRILILPTLVVLLNLLGRAKALQVWGVIVHKVLLRQNDPESLWTYRNLMLLPIFWQLKFGRRLE
jgi:hypothetical protein